MKLHFRKSILGDKYNFFKTDQWDCPYIIRQSDLVIFDIRKYANMSTIDFNFHGYSRINSKHTTLKGALNKIKKLMKTEA